MASDGVQPGRIDWMTVAAVAALAYVAGTAWHEHGGHAAACAALGGHVRGFGAFYVDCDGRAMGATGTRLVALAGPVASVLLGIVASAAWRRMRSPCAQLFWWLLASIGFMTAFGYMLFSAATGIGDLGIGPEGLLHGVRWPWAWRIAMGVVGYWLYDRTVVRSMQRLAALLGGGHRQVQRVRRVALACYVAGGFTSLLIGAFNPQGVVIVLTSAAAASLGGTSGLAWGPYRTRLPAADPRPAVAIPRSVAWIAASVVLVLGYAIVFGPTLAA